MKKILLSLACLYGCHISMAQDVYDFTVTTEPYTSLSGANSLFYFQNDGGYYYDDDFVFPIFKDHDANFMQNNAIPSLGGFLAAQGYLAVYESPDYQTTIVFQIFSTQTLNTIDGVTKAYAKLEGNKGSRILKYELKDQVFQNDPSQTASMQIWLDESDTTISYHFGPNTISGALPAGNTGIIIFNSTFTGLSNKYHLIGNPSAPSASTSATINSIPFLNSLPEDGTVYTFKMKSAATGIATNSGAEEWKVYPNPAGDYINIVSANGADEYKIYNAMGQEIRLGTQAGKSRERIDISDFAPGMYFIKTANQHTQTFLVR